MVSAATRKRRTASYIGAGILPGQGGGGGPTPLGLLRAASPTNWMAGAVLALGSGRRKTVGNWPVWIGSGNMSEVRVLIENFAVAGANIALPGNSITWEEVYLVSDLTGQAVPVLFGGQASRTLTNGEIDVVSDAVLPSAFGLTKFSRDEKYYIRYLASVASSGQNACLHNFSPAYGQFGMYSHTFDPAVTTITNVNGSGPFTSTGTAPTNNRFLSAKLVGKFVAGDPRTYAGIGNSIMEGVGDRSGALGNSGLVAVYAGYFMRAMWENLGVSGARGCINFGLSGGNVPLWTAGAASLNPYLKYVNTAIEEYGTNFFTTGANAGTVSFQVNAIKSAWASILAADKPTTGRPFILARTTLGPRTTGAWAQADGSDQTAYGPMWEVGGDVDLYMDGLRAAIGTANSASVLIDFDSVWRLSTNKADVLYHRWKQNLPIDGAHPAPAGAEAAAVVVRNWCDQLEALAA